LELLLLLHHHNHHNQRHVHMLLPRACTVLWLAILAFCSAAEPASMPCNELPADEAKKCCMLADYLIASAAEQALLSAQGGYAESGDKVYAKLSKRCIAERQQLFDGECAGVEKYGYQKGQCTIGPYMAHRNVAALPKTAPPAKSFIKVRLCTLVRGLHGQSSAIGCSSTQ
jgi:hypothetical protein